ncbi:MAG: right-handed parallel beta-helix repeat-containing protein [Phycisphaerae bacterium]|nr:right-handed parallel beta-helix repeat-containing protein [Phycisphaerae bacterium]
MIRLWGVAVVVAAMACVCDAAAESGPASRPAVIPLGKGLTNAYYIDTDGDGYGPGSPNGPDADDGDPDVNTAASAVKAAGSMEKLLAARGVSGQVYYISPVGNDAAGQPGRADKPFASFAKIAKQLRPSDAAVFLEGKYTGETLIAARGLQGKQDQPIFLLAEPGAHVILDATHACIDLANCRHLVIEGFLCDNSHPKRLGRGVTMNHSRDIRLANLEIRNHFWGIIAMQDLHDVTIESCVIHDNPHEHGIYLGSREKPNSNLVVRNCLIYRNGQQGIQHNGRVTGLRIEGNIIHTNGQAGVQLMQGVRDSTIVGNVIFNNAKQGICLYNYDSSDDAIRPYDQTGNVFEDNIVWVGLHDPFDRYPTSTYAAVLFNDTASRQRSSFDGNTFRRNVLVTSGGPAFMFRQARFADTTIIQENTIFRTGDGGRDRVMTVGDLSVGFAAFERFSEKCTNNTYADPRFLSCREKDFKTPETFDFRRE